MLTLEDYRNFERAARSYFEEKRSGVSLLVQGSFASNTLNPGLSDLDLLLVAQEGEGASLRDSLPAHIAHLGELLTVFVDPYSPIGTICTIYRGPLKVDWFVSEEADGVQRRIWRGNVPPIYDPSGHPWDWIWWLWAKFKAGNIELAREELAKLWLFLLLEGEDPLRFPTSFPSAQADDLERQILATLVTLPDQGGALAQEISAAIRLTYSEGH